jgi:uncharacterized protein (DUF1697 family)
MIYIALLRGINVGGNNIIKMTDLKQMFQTLGIEQVQTYIQSGNVLFISDGHEEALRIQIETAIKNTFGFSVPVILRTLQELESIIHNYPFTEKEITDAESSSEGEVLYVSMFSQMPSQKDIERFAKCEGGDDKYVIAGRDIYFLFSKSIRNSKLAGVFQKTDVPSTARNKKTIAKLVELAKQLSS